MRILTILEVLYETILASIHRQYRLYKYRTTEKRLTTKEVEKGRFRDKNEHPHYSTLNQAVETSSDIQFKCSTLIIPMKLHHYQELNLPLPDTKFHEETTLIHIEVY